MSASDFDRRDFLNVLTPAAAAFALPGVAVANPGARSMAEADKKIVDTDVLVIGRGMAGFFAAIRAKEKGLDVTVLDKGTIGNSGCTPWAGTFTVFDEKEGHKKEDWLKSVRASGEYLNNLVWVEALIDDSLARYEELVSWDLIEVADFGPLLGKQIKERGIRTIERVMAVDLIEQDGRIVGAVGFPMESDELVVVTAKATVLSAGAGAFKPPGYPVSSLTSDGDAMAYRVEQR